MRIAFIHSQKKVGTGAHFINDLMVNRLKEADVEVNNVYPKTPLMEAPVHLKGLTNILFFYSLLENKQQILKHDLIQGTTYTPLAFLAFPIPVVSHFGSTTWGFLQATPQSIDMEDSLRTIWLALKKAKVIDELNVKTRRPLRDVAEIEKFVAIRADAVIATSEIVRDDLLSIGVKPNQVFVIHNAIEDYWFEKQLTYAPHPSLFFLGRMGGDVFTLKLKGLDRLIDLYQHFPNLPKQTVGMTLNNKLVAWMNKTLPHHQFHQNIRKDSIPPLLNAYAGSILFVPSRYEGFSLSLIEGMSQGLIPVTYPVGIAPEIIKNGQNGFLVHSQAEAKKTVSYLLKLSTDERREFAKRAAHTATHFSSDRIARALAKVYKTVIERNRKKRN